MKKFLVLSFCTFLTACGSTYTVKPATGVETGGIHYYLPKNLVRVTVPVTKTVTKQGRYATQITNCFAPANRRTPATPGTSHKLGTPTYTLLSVRDEKHRYFVNLKKPGNPFLTRTGDFNLNQSQVLTSAKTSVTDHTVDWAIDLGQIVADLAMAAGGAGFLLPNNTIRCSGQAAVAVTDLKRVRKLKTDLAAQHRATITEAVYKQKKADLSTLESTLLGLFFGEVTVRKFDLNITLEPDPMWLAPVSLRLFDESMTALSAVENVAKHQYRVSSTAAATVGTGLVLKVVPNRQPGADQTGEGGLYYRLPGDALFKLTWSHTKTTVATLTTPATTRVQTQPLGQKELVIAQFGVTRYLPSKFGAFKSEVSAFTLDPLTGGIQKLTVNGQGLSKDQATDMNKVITKSQADNKVAELTRERDILKLKNEIDELRSSEIE